MKNKMTAVGTEIAAKKVVQKYLLDTWKQYVKELSAPNTWTDNLLLTP